MPPASTTTCVFFLLFILLVVGGIGAAVYFDLVPITVASEETFVGSDVDTPRLFADYDEPNATTGQAVYDGLTKDGSYCPQCSWECNPAVCPQVCKSECDAPDCQIQCKPLAPPKCVVKCDPPKCRNVCPDDDKCLRGKCNLCRVECDPPKCRVECCTPKADCSTRCQPPRCRRVCRKPNDCPAPKCRMVCDGRTGDVMGKGVVVY
jgi:hypothetical protein